MKKLDFTGYKGYTISEGGIVYDSNLVEVPSMLSNNKTCIKVALEDGHTRRYFNVAGLMMIAFELPLVTNKGEISYNNYWRRMWRLTYIDRDVTNCNLHNIRIVDEKDSEIIPSSFTSKSIADAVLNSEYDESILDDTEAFGYVYEAVKYHIAKGSFPSLSGDIDTVDDLVNDIYLVLFRRGLFRKFDSTKAKKKTYVFNAVKNNLVDRLRTQKEAVSLDATTDTEATLLDMLQDTSDLYQDLISNETVLSMINSLSNACNEFIYANSPIIGTCKLTMRIVAIHLYLGYSCKDIADMFDVEPKTITSMKKAIKLALTPNKYLLEAI